MPPDGQFRLASYHLTSSTMMQLPVYVQPQISFITGGTGRFDLTIGQKANVGKVVEQVVANIQMPSQVLNCNLTQSIGSISFDPVKNVLRWDIGKIVPQKVLPNLRGNITLVSGAEPPEDMPVIMLEFRIGQFAISGIKVNRLDVYGERYKPFKGVKYVTKAGKFQVRT